MALHGHRIAEARSLALHREIARRLLLDPRLLVKARERVAEWCRTGSVAPWYASAWHATLQRPLAEIAESIVDPGEDWQALRQVTPFAGIVPARDRWRIWRDVAREASEA